jgi:zinc/manganese transport system permease protein
VLYRPLLMSSFDSELAKVKGVPVRLVGAANMLMLALAVSLSAITVGAVLSTALLIGPGSTAVRLTKRPSMALLAACSIGVICVWLGIVLSYDSSSWPGHHGWPVSFSVVAVIFVFYLAADFYGRLRSKWAKSHQDRHMEKEAMCSPAS